MVSFFRIGLTVIPAIILSLLAIIVVTPLSLFNPWLRYYGIASCYWPNYWYQNRWAKILLWCLGVEAEYHGLEHVPVNQPTITVSNHPSAIDMFVVAASPVPFRLLMKREVLWQLPIISWAAVAMGHQVIDRSSKTSIAGLNSLVDSSTNEAVTTYIFPEGTRTKSGLMGPFKKGAFHAAKNKKLPIVPATITYNGTKSCLRYLPVISYDSNRSVNDTLDACHEVIRRQLSDNHVQ